MFNQGTHEKMLSIIVNRGMQIKMMKSYFTPIRMAKNSYTETKKTTVLTNCWQGNGTVVAFIHFWLEWKTANLLGKQFGNFLSSNLTPSCLPKRNETYVHKKTFTRMFIATVFTIARNWGRPSCSLLVDSRLNWVNCAVLIECHSVIKRNDPC